MDARDEAVLAEYHEQLPQALNCLLAADIAMVGVYARQAVEFAPKHDRAEDTVILVLRGPQMVTLGRKVVTELADVLREASRSW